MKFLKVLIIVFIAIIVLAIMLTIIGTIGLKEVKNLEVEHIDLNLVEDSVYEGSYDNFRWSNDVIVTIKDHEIVEIESVNRDETDSQYEVYMEIIDAIINQQRNDIDTVSSATATTNSFLKAVEDALN